MLTIEGTRSWHRTRELSAQAGDDVKRWQDELETRGILFIADDHFLGSTHPDFYHSTQHSPWSVFEHWTRFFDIAAYIPDGSDTQDMVLLTRHPNDVPGLKPIGRRTLPSDHDDFGSARASADPPLNESVRPSRVRAKYPRWAPRQSNLAGSS